MSAEFPRGVYIDKRNGDMWTQSSIEREAWRWVNGDNGYMTKDAKSHLEKVDDLPNWY